MDEYGKWMISCDLKLADWQALTSSICGTTGLLHAIMNQLGCI
jgi:hypothetical protein